MEPEKKTGDGSCDHFQPADLAKLAEAHLAATGVPNDKWEGCRFGYGGGGGSGPFKSVYMEVKRKQGNWVVVKLDRRPDELPPGLAGFKVVQPPAI